MRFACVLATVLLGCFGVLPPALGEEAPSNAFDGEWAVVLVCADTQDKNGLVKGYDFTFHVSIKNGKLQGQYGAKGRPASLVNSGEVAPDGTLEIRATGNTGQSDTTVGRVPRGSEYAYAMTGKLEQARGQAVRRELRPCTATFSKL